MQCIYHISTSSDSVLTGILALEMFLRVSFFIIKFIRFRRSTLTCMFVLRLNCLNVLLNDCLLKLNIVTPIWIFCLADLNYNTQITERQTHDMKERFSEQSTPLVVFKRQLCSDLWFLISGGVKWPFPAPELNFSKEEKFVWSQLRWIGCSSDIPPLCDAVALIKKLLAGIVGILKWNQ